jgi:hypothetical protein
MKTNFCLIPTTGRETLRRAFESAYEWETLTRTDSERRGAGWTRNRLVESALKAGAEYIRFADDDDIVVGGNSKMLLEPFADPGIDLVAFDAVFLCRAGQSPLIRPSGDPAVMLKRAAYPWNFVARASALERMRASHGSVFREDVPCRLGSWFWLRAFQTGLKVGIVPVVGYLHFDWDDAADSERLSRLPQYFRESCGFRDAADAWLKEVGR